MSMACFMSACSLTPARVVIEVPLFATVQAVGHLARAARTETNANSPERPFGVMLPPMNDREAVKVLIVNDDGQYLAGTASDWEFTDDRGKAKVFDYWTDRVAERIELVRKAHGRVWIAVKLDPREV